MIQTFQDIQNILVLAPHPDDEALGCSGTIALLNGKGAASTIVFLTDGERLHGGPSKDIAEKRRDEGKKVSQMLGCNEPIFLGFPDGDVGSHITEISSRLTEVIAETGPEIILAPSLIDYHNDHIATARIALELFKSTRPFKLAFYEVYSTIRFNCLMDISEAISRKKDAILAYNTSLYEKPDIYVHASLGLNAQRSIFVQKTGYYEVFYLPDKTESEESILKYFSCRG